MKHHNPSIPTHDYLGEEMLAQKNTTICNNQPQMLSRTPRSLTICWLDSVEAAQFLKVSAPMLRNMASNGQVPFYKLGRRNRYRCDELEALLLQNRRGPS